MKRLYRLSFRTKLFLGIMLVTISIVLAFSFMFYNYSIDNIRRAEQQRGSQVSEVISSQIDQMYRQMESACINIVYDEELKNAVYSLAYGKELLDEQRLTYERIINASLQRTVLYLRNVVKVAIFNCERGLYYSAGVFDTSVSYVNRRLANVEWYENLFDAGEWQYFVAPQQSEWFEGPTPVVGVVRKFDHSADQNPAVLQIQMPYETLNTICSVNYTDMDSEVLVLNKRGEVVYPLSGSRYFSDDELEPLREQVRLTTSPGAYSSPAGQGLMYAYCYSRYTGLSSVFIIGRNKLDAQTGYFRTLTLLLICLVAGLMLGSFLLLIYLTTRPLNKIVHTLQQVDISHMSYQIPGDTQNEWLLLNTAIQQMLDHLRESVQDVYEARLRAMDAQFAMLQSQINPHFLHNTLNIIAIRCEDEGRAETAAMCCQLSALLRYSCSIEPRSVSVKEEVGYTRNYLQLMKMHYEELLRFTIDIPEALLERLMPKMTLQPLVENSLSHGLERVAPPWAIEISGRVLEGCGWSITVRDNGAGMDDEILARLRRECDGYTAAVTGGSLTPDQSIGGIGIPNTFARLLLCWKERTLFEMKNLAPGFSVTFGCLPEAAPPREEGTHAH